VLRLLPGPAADIDPEEWHAGLVRSTPSGRPWVMGNMVASADGAAALEGRSGGLGDAADRRVFHALRALPDTILAGAGTVRAERYGPPATDEATAEARRARGQEPTPRLAIVSASLDLPLDLPALQDPEHPPLVITCTRAPAAARRALEGRAELFDAGEATVSMTQALGALAEHGDRLVLCEGGPKLNAHLLADGLLDELNLTISPLIVGGSAARIVSDGSSSRVSASRVEMELAHLLEQDGALFARYLIRR
jgi:riboflavin biosynthesis pyrimidine reductase